MIYQPKVELQERIKNWERERERERERIITFSRENVRESSKFIENKIKRKGVKIKDINIKLAKPC